MTLQALLGLSFLMLGADAVQQRVGPTPVSTSVMTLLALGALATVGMWSEGCLLLPMWIVGLSMQWLWTRSGTSVLSLEVYRGIALTVLAVFFQTLLRVYLLEAMYAFQPAWWGLSALGVGLLAQIIVLLLVEELVAYWIHRLDHTIPILWRLHRLHHATTELNLFATDRDHPWFTFVRFFTMFAVSFTLGVSAEALLVAGIIRGTVNTTNHWDVDFPRFDGWWRGWSLLVSTPNYHAWHHTVHAGDRANLAELLPVVDWIFGTLEVPQGDPAEWEFGLVESERVPVGLAEQLLSPVWSMPVRRGGE